jgi:cytochrome c
MTIKKLFGMLVALLCIVGFQATAVAQDRGTKDEAKAMVDAAVEHVKKVGPEQAFKDFSTDKATWAKKDLYVFAYNMKGDCTAHGSNSALVGKNQMDLKDTTGKPIVKELIEKASSAGQGWVTYEWNHPQTKKPEPKDTYVQKLSNFDGLVGVGAYRN